PDIERMARVGLATLSRVAGGVVVARERSHRVQDRPVSGAPAQVAAEEVFHVLLRRPGCGAEKRMRVHHEAGRAEPALGAVVQRQAVLDRVEPVLHAADPFDRRDMAAGHSGQGAETRVDRAMVVAAGGPPAYHDGAGTTPPLPAADLGPGDTQVANVV